MTEEEADGLYDGHQRKDDAHRRGRLGVYLSHEIRVGHVIERGDQHTDDGRYGQPRNQSRYGGGGQLLVVLFGRVMVHRKYLIRLFIYLQAHNSLQQAGNGGTLMGRARRIVQDKRFAAGINPASRLGLRAGVNPVAQ